MAAGGPLRHNFNDVNGLMLSPDGLICSSKSRKWGKRARSHNLFVKFRSKVQ